ncbi:MAG: DUF6361 family protein, partial [Acidimicrobiia bacterium]
VRDAFSEMLFPGVSTVQTRSRYFLFVPWIYRSLDRNHIGTAAGIRVARERETGLIEALLRGSDDHEGIIGRYSRQTTKQLPSLIYWGGLGTWSIRRFDGSSHDYIATLDSRWLAQSRQDDEVGTIGAWHQGLPEPPHDLLDETTLDLTRDEAEFLQGRILTSVPDTYLAHLARDGRVHDAGDWPWAHRLAATAPVAVADQVNHAHLLAVAAWGAALTYNDELSRLLVDDGHQHVGDDYGALLDQWCDEIGALAGEFAAWDRHAFWATVYRQNPRVSGGVRSFVDWWLDLALTNPARAGRDAEVRERLREREAALKGPRAKLANRRARERSPSAQGDDLMSFRWPRVSTILGDIHRGLERDAQPA